MTLQVFVALLIAGLVQAQAPTPAPVCTPVKPGGDIPPITLDNEFQLRIEAVSKETNRVTNIVMFYSLIRSQIRLFITDNGVKSDQFFYFKDNEILTFQYSDNGVGTCTVNTDLKNAADTFIVGGARDGDIGNPLAVLHFLGDDGFGNQLIKTYLGNTTFVREMPTDAFYSCQKWTFGPQSAVVNVTHYFSLTDGVWSRPETGRVPILTRIQGSAVLHGQVYSIDHYYNFFDYTTDFDRTHFETPPGIVCEGRNVDMPFPPLPDYLKMSGESVNNFGAPSMSYFSEIYDVPDSLVMVRTQLQTDFGTEGGMGHILVIRDYVTGLSYLIDKQGDFCRVQNISQANPLPFDYISPQGYVKEVTPDQFFYKTNTKYEYLGERQVRGMIADTWVARTTMPQFPETSVVAEWYFAKTNVRSWNDGSKYYKQGGYRMPVLLRLWAATGQLQNSIDFNLYHVDFTKVMYGVIDIRMCYPEKASNYFQLILKGAKEQVVNTDIDRFKWQASFDLAAAAGVRWMRIADIQVYFSDADAILEFEMLDAPPYSGDVQGAPTSYTSLQLATTNLQNAMAKGMLSIKVWNPNAGDLTRAIPVTNFAFVSGTAPNPSSSDNGYSAGAMAGLGVAMIVIGGVAGGVGANFFFK